MRKWWIHKKINKWPWSKNNLKSKIEEIKEKKKFERNVFDKENEWKWMTVLKRENVWMFWKNDDWLWKKVDECWKMMKWKNGEKWNEC